MATRARFGRLPRAAPSLTSTIVALAEQYQNKRDQNIEDAWKNGGTFEGKQVTDKAFLAHWQQRLAGVSERDPMHDYYQNLIHNYNFMIAESKMGEKYAEKSVSDGQMADFYRSEAKKLPVDSEAYRNLMTQAAKFQSAATARAHGNAARSASEAYGRAQQNTYNTHEAPFLTAQNLIAQYAVERGILDAKDLNSPDSGFSKLTNATGENDPSNFANLLTDLQADPKVSAYITDQIKRYDPNFSGQFNEQTLNALANTARNGAVIRKTRAQKAGLKGDTTAATKAVGDYSLSSTVLRVSLGTSPHTSFVEQNDFHRGEMDKKLAPDSGASPMERQVAVQEYRDWLMGAGFTTFTNALPKGALAPGSKNFDATAAGIFGRINNTLHNLGANIDPLTGKMTYVTPYSSGQNLKDDLYGFSTEQAGPSSDAATLSTKVAGQAAGLDAVAAGQGIVVRTSGTGQGVKPDPNGNDWTIYSPNAPEVQGNDNLIPTAVPAHGTYVTSDGKSVLGGGSGGEVRFNVAVPVKVRLFPQRDPATGAYSGPGGTGPGAANQPNPGSDAVVGKQVNIVGPGGVTVPVYGTYVGGRLLWSTVDPIRGADPANPGSIFGTQTTTTDKDGTIVHAYTMAGEPGPKVPGQPRQTWNPQDAVDTTKLTGPGLKPNWNPQTDKQTAFDSPFAAASHSSDPALNWVAGIGDNAIRNAERAWFSNRANWTPDMNAQAANGIDPLVIVDQKSNQLLAVAKTATTDPSLSPEYQNAQRAQAAAQAPMVASGEWQARQDAAARADLATQLADWNLANTPKPTGPMGGMGGAAAFWATRTGPSTPVSPLPKGWGIGDLLNQPGMNLMQANDLVYQITGGAKGKPGTFPEQPWNLVPGYKPPAQFAGSTVPGTNPFLPKPGTTGPSFNLGPAAGPTAKGPTPVKPTPVTPVKPVGASPYNIHGGVTTPTAVNIHGGVPATTSSYNIHGGVSKPI